MSNAKVQGELWGKSPHGWAEIQEPQHAPLWDAMMNAAMVGSKTRMLDAGCGGGNSSAMAAARGARVTGIDAAEGLLNYARKRVPNSDFRVGDIEYLPFEDDEFDVVFAANSVQFPTDSRNTLRGFARVCVPNGRIVAGLFGPPERVAYTSVLAAQRAVLPEPPSGKGPFELSAPGALEALFAKADLNVLGSGEVNCPFRYDSFETFFQAITSAGPTQGLISAIGAEKVRSVLKEGSEPFTQADGQIVIEPNIFIYVVASP